MDIADLVLPLKHGTYTRSRASLPAWLCAVTAFALALALVAPRISHAHGFEPGVLELREQTGGLVTVRYRPPTAGGDAAGEGGTTGITIELPEGCQSVRPREPEVANVRPSGDGEGSQRVWALRCRGGIARGRVAIPALTSLGVDVFVHIVLADEREDSHVIGPTNPSWSWDHSRNGPSHASMARTLSRYFTLGIRHIASGWDHMLFLVGLVLVARSARRIVLAVTCFTAGHAASLVLATLGVLRVSQPPVEALIALSITVMAAEVLKPENDSLLRRYTWMASTGFGLLHGLGFAAALRELEVPSGARWLALASFNVGVEVGQLAVVAIWVAMVSVGRRFVVRRGDSTVRVLAYGIGCVGAWACIDRVSQL